VVNKVLGELASVVQMNNGGLFSPNKMWAAVVDRHGVLCNVIRSDPDAWPGSRDIAIAKAFTANGFSNDQLALSTANLYGPTQPGGSLYGLNNSNPFNAFFNRQGTGNGFTLGGIITFGGGVALYQGGQVIGGLGVSGDTSCADHAIGCAPKPVMGRFPLASGRTTPIISTTIRLDFCRARLIRLSSHNPTASRLTLHPEKNRGPVTAVKTESGLIGQPPGSDLHLAFVRCGSTPPYNQSAPGEAGGATFLRACSPSLVVPRTN
jgi:uncharacterized protein GlcG (DUF336 family)